MPTIRQPGRQLPEYLIFLLVFLAALAVRLYRLDATSFWLDEVIEVGDALSPWPEIWAKTPHGRSPLEYYMVAAFLRIGHNEFWGRMHAVLLGAGFVAVMGWWGRRIGGWALGAAAVLLTITLPVHVRFSQEASCYAIMLFSQVLFYAQAWHMFYRPGRPRAGQWAMLVFTAALMLWSHEPNWLAMALAVPMVAVWFVLTRRRGADWAAFFKSYGPPLLVSSLALGLLFLPLLLRSLAKVPESFPFTWDQTFSSYKQMIVLYLDTFAQGYDYYEFTPKAGRALVVLAAIGMLGIFAKRRFRLMAVFCFVLFIVPFAGMFAIMKIKDHFMEMRYTMVGMPPLLMLASMGLMFTGRAVALLARRGAPRRRTAIAVTAALAAIPFVVNGLWVHDHPVPRPDYRAVMETIKASGDTSTITGLQFYDRIPLEYYKQRYGLTNPVQELNDNPEQLLQTKGWFLHSHVADPRDHTAFMYKLAPAGQFTLLRLYHTDPTVTRFYEKMPPLTAAQPRLMIEPGDPAEPHIGGGWYQPEDYGTWRARSFGPEGGSLFFRVGEPMTGLTLHIKAAAYTLGERFVSKSMTLWLDGEPVAVRETGPGLNELHIELPDLALEPGVHRLRFEPETSAKPNKFDPSQPQDWRLLSYWIWTLDLRSP